LKTIRNETNINDPNHIIGYRVDTQPLNNTPVEMKKENELDINRLLARSNPKFSSLLYNTKFKNKKIPSIAA
jgi:hypothetical protein